MYFLAFSSFCPYTVITNYGVYFYVIVHYIFLCITHFFIDFVIVPKNQ